MLADRFTWLIQVALSWQATGMKHDDPHTGHSTDALERKARKRVKQLTEFYTHLGSYLLINSFLICLNLLTAPHTLWAIWPVLGWGVGLASHAVSVFGLLGIGGKAWQERKAREFTLQQQRGLSAEQVRHLFREELRPDTHVVLSQAEWQAVLRRLENLETIVTSKDWTFMEQLSDAAHGTAASSESKAGPNGLRQEDAAKPGAV